MRKHSSWSARALLLIDFIIGGIFWARCINEGDTCSTANEASRKVYVVGPDRASNQTTQYADLQVLLREHGTRTRDLRRDRPVLVSPVRAEVGGDYPGRAGLSNRRLAGIGGRLREPPATSCGMSAGCSVVSLGNERDLRGMRSWFSSRPPAANARA